MMKKISMTVVILLSLVGLLVHLHSKEHKNKVDLPSKRTQEQYDLEQEFQPLFDFLEAKDKDWGKVERYQVYTIERINNQKTVTRISLDNVNSRFYGKYQLEQGTIKKESEISLENNRINAHNKDLNSPLAQKFFTIQVPRGYFRESPIVDYLMKHPETNLRTITYEFYGKQFSELVDIYGLQSIEKCDVELWQESNNQYSLEVVFGENNRFFVIHYSLLFKE